MNTVHVWGFFPMNYPPFRGEYAIDVFLEHIWFNLTQRAPWDCVMKQNSVNEDY